MKRNNKIRTLRPSFVNRSVKLAFESMLINTASFWMIVIEIFNCHRSGGPKDIHAMNYMLGYIKSIFTRKQLEKKIIELVKYNCLILKEDPNYGAALSSLIALTVFIKLLGSGKPYFTKKFMKNISELYDREPKIIVD